MKITTQPPANPTYTIELSRDELEVLFALSYTSETGVIDLGPGRRFWCAIERAFPDVSDSARAQFGFLARFGFRARR